MRSNDAWLGLPYDLMQFGMLQCAISQALGLPVGVQTHSAGSMHLYKRNFPKALLVREPNGMERQTFDGPMWGAHDISGIASRARRILLGQWDKLDSDLTDFELWCAEALGL